MGALTNEDSENMSSWLDRNQFEHVSSIGGDSAPFGDRQDTWERDGTLIRLNRDRGQWFYDVSHVGADSWLDVDEVAVVMGIKETAPSERVAAMASSVDDRVFSALTTAVRHAP